MTVKHCMFMAMHHAEKREQFPLADRYRAYGNSNNWNRSVLKTIRTRQKYRKRDLFVSSCFEFLQVVRIWIIQFDLELRASNGRFEIFFESTINKFAYWRDINKHPRRRIIYELINSFVFLPSLPFLVIMNWTHRQKASSSYVAYFVVYIPTHSR